MASSGQYDWSSTNKTHVSWVSDPPVRGTASILLSCLSTLFLCVWTAMHLNLPRKQDSTAHYTWRYTKWCLMALIGPELVLWAAWRQFISARSLLIESKTQSWQPLRRISSGERAAPFTMTHGFYAGMGGFVVAMDDEHLCDDIPFLPDCGRLVITPKGINLLAQCGCLQSIEEQEILDKSKTDSLGKLIAIVQGLWMVVQVITRLSTHLPVTLLEVMTIGHVLCAFFVYLMWWYKPRWVTKPTRLSGPWLRPLLAFMFMSSHISTHTDEKLGILRDLGPRSEIAKLIYLPQCSCTPTNTDKTSSESAAAAMPELKHWRSDEDSSKGCFMLRKTRIPTRDRKPDEEIPMETTTVVMDEATHERWSLAVQALDEYPAIRALLQPARTRPDTKFEDALRNYPDMPEKFKRAIVTEPSKSDVVVGLAFDGEQFVTYEADNWPSEDLFRRTKGLLMGSVIWFGTIGFSAVHIAAWHAEFPSNAEAWLWRVSSLYIGGSGVLWLTLHIFANESSTLWWYWYDVLAGTVPRFHYLLLGTVCSICGCLYLFARTFLVVEAFISLRWLPMAAYVTPNWVVTVPHFN